MDLYAKIKLRDCPRRRDTRQAVERNGNSGGNQSQFDRTQCQRVAERLKIKAETLPQSLGKNGDERQHEKQRDERQRDRDEQPAHERRFGPGDAAR